MHELSANSGDLEFRRQLQLARSDGIPVTGAEFKAFIHTAIPAQNAALLYRQLRGKTRSETDPTNLDQNVLFHPSAESLDEAQRTLDEHSKLLNVVDRAVLLPRCWFDRDWSKGAAVIMPELADMKSAVRFLSLRGSVASQEGQVRSALKDATEILAVARHAGKEPTQIASMVRESIEQIGMRELSSWAFLHPDQPAYRQALKKAVDELARPDLKSEHRSDLFMLLSLIDLTSSTEGRKELGMRDRDYDIVGADLMQVLFSRSKAKVQIVQAERDCWSALDLPANKRQAAVGDANRRIEEALMAFPMAYRSGYGSYGLNSAREQVWEARRLTYLALLRALAAKSVPTSIKTTDLLSPFDGKPLTYHFDGTQIEIDVSDGGHTGLVRPFKLPVDSALKK